MLPFLPSPVLQCLTCVAFPGVGAIVAAAASISKARCEVDAAAATAAAAQIARARLAARVGSWGGGTVIEPVRARG